MSGRKTAQTRKGFIMTKKDVLMIALSNLTDDTYTLTRKNVRYADGHIGDAVDTLNGKEVREVLSKMIEQLSKPRVTSEEAKAKQAQARKEKTSAERAKVLSEVVTPIRAAMDKNPRTADEIYHRAKDMLPADWTTAKVRYVLTHGELGEDVKSIDNGRNPHTYHL